MAKEPSRKAKDRGTRQFHLSRPNAVQTTVDCFYFNRFALEEDEGFILVYLGAVIQGEVLNCNVVALAKVDVTNAFTISKDYIAALGTVSQEPPKSWGYPRTKLRLDCANVVELSHTGDVGEVSFSNYGIHDLAMVRQGLFRELYGYRALAARSSIALHRQLVGNLFKGMS